MLFKVCTMLTVLMCLVIKGLFSMSGEGLVMIGELVSGARLLFA